MVTSMQALYIEAKQGAQVNWDAPTLRVSVPEQSDRLFPLGRVSRVLCADSVSWSMDSLFACADAGIPVVFVDEHGDIRARCWGKPSKREHLTQALLNVLVFPEGRDAYRDWWTALEKLAARSFARRMHLSSWRDVKVTDLKLWLNATFLKYDPKVIKMLEACIQAEIPLLTLGSELAFDDEVLLQEGLDLEKDLAALLIWDFYEGLIQHDASEPRVELADLAKLIEKRKPRLQKLLNTILLKLRRFLTELDYAG